MATLQDTIHQNFTYVCDKCKKTFKAEEVKLVPAPTNFQICSPGFHIMVIEKDGTIVGKQKFNEGDRSLACPRCGEDHPHGFNLSE